jgi:hypothetical protein
MTAMGGGEGMLLPIIKCKKKKMRRWDWLPRITVRCQEIVEMGGGEGLPGAAATKQKIRDMGGT